VAELTEEEKRRIREELRYAHLVLGSERAERKPRWARALDLAGSAFVLTVIGALLTYFVGPTLQRRYDEHNRRKQAAQDCFTEFMKYAVSPFEEYYATLPLANKSRIDEKVFDEYQAKVTAIHLRRFEAYARIQGQLTVLRGRSGSDEAVAAVKDYAVTVRQFADLLDAWLNQLRCEPHCVDDGGPPTSTASRYESMHTALHALEAREATPTELILTLGAQ
jgi:hypothetical protein